QVFTGTGAIGNDGSLKGLIVNWANAGNSFLGSGGFADDFNTETAPDVIGKAAFDPGWGITKYSVLPASFTDSVFTCSVVAANGVYPTTVTNVGNASRLLASIDRCRAMLRRSKARIPKHFDRDGISRPGLNSHRSRT